MRADGSSILDFKFEILDWQRFDGFPAKRLEARSTI